MIIELLKKVSVQLAVVVHQGPPPFLIIAPVYDFNKSLIICYFFNVLDIRFYLTFFPALIPFELILLITSSSWEAKRVREKCRIRTPCVFYAAALFALGLAQQHGWGSSALVRMDAQSFSQVSAPRSSRAILAYPRYRLASFLTCKIVRCIIGDPFLTGVGVFMRRGETLVAPCDENKRYDDYGYRASERDEFSSMCTLHDDSKTGYVFHESCWKLLKTLLYPSPVPIQTLYNICRSCPIPNPGYVELGLDYWGLAKKNPALPYPWEGFHILRRLIPEQGRRNIMGWKCDPFDIPELQSLLDETQQQAQQEETKASVSPSFKKQPDCFSSLPPELLDEIRILLPSADVVNLHLASRSFASLPLSQYFWASRFRQRFERSHIFEPTIPDYDAQGRKCRRDWKRLYKKTARSYSPSTKLENRARVWNCASLLADLLVEIPPVDDTAIEGFQGVDTGARQWEAIPGWKWVGGDFRPQSPDLPSAGDFRPPRSPDLPSSMACNIRFDQNVVVPEDLVQIGVSLLYFHNRQYISGLRLISRGKRDVQLGYKLPKKEVILDLKSQDGDQNILTGFVCALGARGIHGLRVVTSGGQLSEWAGCTSVLPQTLRLRVEQPISRIKAAFDVCVLSYLTAMVGLIRFSVAKTNVLAGIQNGWPGSAGCTKSQCCDG